MIRLYADDGFGNLIPVHPVRLVDGRIVSSYSEEWRHECEARHLAQMRPLEARRAYLYGKYNQWGALWGGIEQRRGPVARKTLEETARRIFFTRRGVSVDKSK